MDRTILLVVVVAGIAAAAIAEADLDFCQECIRVDAGCYNSSHLVELPANFRDTVVIRRMGLLKPTNTLFYAYEPDIKDLEYYKVAYINLDKHEIYGTVAGPTNVSNFGSFDFYQGKNKVYLSSPNGVFQFADNKTTFFSSRGEDVDYLVFIGNVLFVKRDDGKSDDGKSDDGKIVEKIGDQFITYEDYRAVKQFTLTENRKYIVYLNRTGLYLNKFKRDETVYLSKNSFFRGITKSLEDTIYVWWIDSIYKVEINEQKFHKSRLVKVAEISGLGAMVFDGSDNILFNNNKGLYKLTKTEATEC